jgi:type I restriction enzyme S subunit
MKDAQNKLPKGWAPTNIGEICTALQYGYTASASDEACGPRFLRITDIQNGRVQWSTVPYCEIDDSQASKYELRAGDIVFARTGGTVGKSFIITSVPEQSVFASYLIRLSAHPEIEPKFLYFFFQSTSYWEQIGLKKGGLQGNVNATTLSSLVLYVCPLNEQRRIVARVEELFSELDKGFESLTVAREQLKVYRQAVLKHAFEGKLTTQWREAHKDKLESADQLLANINKEHEARHQQQLANWRAEVKEWETNGETGKRPSKPSTTDELQRLSKEEVSALPPLPTGYVYTYLSNLGDLGRGKSKHRPRNDPRLFGGEYPFIQTGDVKAANRFVRSYHQTYNDLGLTQSHLWPKGTLCITIAANIAETAFLGLDACFPDSVVGFCALEAVVLPEYVELFIKAVRVRIESYAPATAQKNINLVTLENLVVPYCSIGAQRYLVDRVEALLSIIDKNEAEIEDAVVRSKSLRQSILKKAFSGQLVAQDPKDEPASVLLERIKAEKARLDKDNKNNKRKDAA